VLKPAGNPGRIIELVKQSRLKLIVSPATPEGACTCTSKTRERYCFVRCFFFFFSFLLNPVNPV